MIGELRSGAGVKGGSFLFIKKLSEAKPLTRLGEKRSYNILSGG